MKREYKITQEMLIAILQGKELRLVEYDYSEPEIKIKHEFVFHPPFDGVWLTHEQLDNIRHQGQMDVINMLNSIYAHEEELKPWNKP